MPENQGIFTKKSKIVDVVARYNVKETWQKREDDISLEITLDIGKDFQPTYKIGGYFNRNDDGTIKNNGTATKVKILLESAGLNWEDSLDENNQLSDTALEKLQGAEICTLSYVYGTKPNGKTGWTYWNEVGKPSDSDALKAKFHKAVESGWVKDYRPNESESSGSSDSKDFQL